LIEPSPPEKEPKNPVGNAALLTDSWLKIVRGLVGVASLVTVYLAYVSLALGGGVPGCGPDSGCDRVLSSPWAYWLGIPVSLPGLGLYAIFLINTFSLRPDEPEKARRTLNVLTLCACVMICAAVWFVGVQAVAIQEFCPFCCTAHALASLGAIIFLWNASAVGNRLAVRLDLNRAMGAAVAAVAVIAGVQLVAPTRPPPPKIVDLRHHNNTKSLNKPGQGGKAGTLPVIEFRDGPKPVKVIETDPNLFPIPGTELRLKVDHLPMMGSVEATHRIGLLFDYTCHDCRDFHGYMREAVKAFDGQLACVLIPMPLDAKCNPVVKETRSTHVDACEYAKICLAVHFSAPEKYKAFDRWLFSDHKQQKKLEVVRQHAAQMVGADALEKALSGEAVQEQLQQNIRAYKFTSEYVKSGSMPQSIIEGRVMYGAADSVDQVKVGLKDILNLK